ncbi:claudin-14-like isoform X2 [Polyodon spathula]|uniref:claudin-14-like isoform X2 n=1 Tax=Polyodon spathula TaxID=7913 RepID=UPI001B7F56E9|nr:claudin-14-like isoform X2 [Polyodon spathula]
MSSTGLELIGFILGMLGFLGTLVATILPNWRTTAHIGSNIITSMGYRKGLWMECAYLSMGTIQCKTYNSLLALPSDLQAARAMMVISVALSSLGCAISCIGMKCTTCMLESSARSKVAGTGGCCFLAAGFMCLIPVSWTTNEVISIFYNPNLSSSYKYEMGESLYVGMVSALLSFLGGGILCASCCGQEEGARHFGLGGRHPYPISNPQHSQQMTFRNPSVHNSNDHPQSKDPRPPASSSRTQRTNFNGYNLNGLHFYWVLTKISPRLNQQTQGRELVCCGLCVCCHRSELM